MTSRNTTSVLVVDDDVVDCEASCRLIGDRYEVEQSNTLAEARTRLAASEFDCVLLDYELPDGRGCELIPELDKAGVAVVVLTGHGEAEVAVEALRHGADDYLGKDRLDEGLIVQAIDRAVERRLHRRRVDLKYKQLEEFAYCAAHDIKAPLRRIASFCKMVLEDSQELSTKLAQNLHIVVENSQALQRLVDDLLKYAESGRSNSVSEQVNLAEVAREVVAMVRPPEREDEVDVEIGPLPVIRGDRVAWRQILQNLVSNAIKFCGESAPWVRIWSRRKTGTAEICVSDNGIGIPPRCREAIFAPLKRLRAKRVKGSGLGLAICQRLVERQGGRISVDSEPGEGTTFRIVLDEDSVIVTQVVGRKESDTVNSETKLAAVVG